MEHENILDQFVDKEDLNFSKKCSTITEDIRNGRLTVLKLIELLENLLINQSPSKRELGITIFTEVLKKLPSEFLTSQQLQVIAMFYAERFKDHHQVLPCTLKGILTIIEFENFPGESIPALLNSLFRNVACQQQQQADRYTIYCIFQVLLRRFSSEVVSMKLEFVYGVLTAIDGERDPKNLLFLFKWLKKCLGLVTLGHLTEDMFDALACYFPVDFRAPPSEKSVTREALAEALSPCLCAIPDFGEHCIPLALEKLDSSLEIAKIDSLQLLRKGCHIFEHSIYLEKGPEICSQLQKEIFSANNNSEIKSECLHTLSDIINKVSQPDEDEQYKDILKNIIDSVKGNLLPESKHFDTSTKILFYAALGSKKSSSYVAEEVIPLLMNIHLMAAKPDQKCLVLEALIDLTKCYLKYHKNLDNCGSNPELSRIPLLCLEVLTNDSSCRKVGYDSLASLAHCLSSEVRLKLYDDLRMSILTVGESDLRESLLECLKTLAKFYGDELKEKVFAHNTLDSTVVARILNAQCVLVHLNGYRDYVVDNFIHCITNSEFAAAALKNMIALLDQKSVSTNNISVVLIQKGIVDILFELSFSQHASEKLLIDISKILKLLMGPQSSEIQLKILEKYSELLYNKTMDAEVNIILLDGLLTTLRRDIQIDYKFLDVSLDVAQGYMTGLEETAMQLLANLINKRTEGEILDTYLDKIKDQCFRLLKTSHYNSIIIISWITKALLMRNHPQSIPWLDYLLGMIEEYNEVADGLKIIMNDGYESMSLSCQCNKMLLYRQKAFVHISNTISKNFSTNKIVHSKAIGYLIEFTPMQALLLQFKKIFNLIILCLEKNEEPEVLCILLRTVKSVLAEQSALIEDHLEDFLTRILKLTIFEQSLKVRMEALQCLVQFTSLFPVYKLLPFKNLVLQQLGLCVDDKKRLVRKEAMEARSLWFLLDAPE